jgi:hypothetical protein
VQHGKLSINVRAARRFVMDVSCYIAFVFVTLQSAHLLLDVCASPFTFLLRVNLKFHVRLLAASYLNPLTFSFI